MNEGTFIFFSFDNVILLAKERGAVIRKTKEARLKRT